MYICDLLFGFYSSLNVEILLFASENNYYEFTLNAKNISKANFTNEISFVYGFYLFLLKIPTFVLPLMGFLVQGYRNYYRRSNECIYAL